MFLNQIKIKKSLCLIIFEYVNLSKCRDPSSPPPPHPLSTRSGRRKRSPAVGSYVINVEVKLSNVITRTKNDVPPWTGGSGASLGGRKIKTTCHQLDDPQRYTRVYSTSVDRAKTTASVYLIYYPASVCVAFEVVPGGLSPPRGWSYKHSCARVYIEYPGSRLLLEIKSLASIWASANAATVAVTTRYIVLV